MAAYVGVKLRVSTIGGDEFQGILHSFDANSKKISLMKGEFYSLFSQFRGVCGAIIGTIAECRATWTVHVQNLKEEHKRPTQSLGLVQLLS